MTSRRSALLIHSPDYYQALSATAPGVGGVLLRDCLARVHQDIVTCWNFKYGDQVK